MIRKTPIILITIFLALFIVAGYYRDAFFNTDSDLPKAAGLPTKCSQFSIDVYQKATSEIDSNVSQYIQTSKDVIGLSTEGGRQLDYKDRNGGIKFTRQTFYGETFRSEIGYYFSDNKAFFITVSRFEYDRPIYIEPEVDRKITKIVVRDFYLNKSEEVCIWYLDKGLQQNDANTEQFIAYLISTLRQR